MTGHSAACTRKSNEDCPVEFASEQDVWIGWVFQEVKMSILGLQKPWWRWGSVQNLVP